VGKLAMAAAITALCAAAARGQQVSQPPPKEMRNRVILGGGFALPVPTNGFRDIADRGYAISVEYYRAIVPQFSLGAELAGFGLGTKFTGDDQLRKRAETAASQLLVLARWEPLPEERVNPYASFGLGTASFHETDTLTLTDQQTLDEGSTEFGAKIGVGVQTDITKRVFGGVESNWRYLTVDRSKFNRTAVQILDIGGRLGCRF
jgi:opacity protein-like surface antigen